MYTFLCLTLFTMGSCKSKRTHASISLTCKTRLTNGVVDAVSTITSILKNDKKKSVNRTEK